MLAAAMMVVMGVEEITCVGIYKRGGREQSVLARAVCVRGKAEVRVAISPLPLGTGAGQVQDLARSHCLAR